MERDSMSEAASRRFDDVLAKFSVLSGDSDKTRRQFIIVLRKPAGSASPVLPR